MEVDSARKKTGGGATHSGGAGVRPGGNAFDILIKLDPDVGAIV
jgi:hypothetical protein